MTTFLILGASGQVGAQLLAQALADARIAAVVAPTRRPLPAAPRLVNPVMDFAALPADAPWWRADAALCALGTTRKQAGSDAAFEAVDHGLVLAAARLTRAAGTPTFVLNSSVGADTASRTLYLRTKGRAEDDVAALGFASFTAVRPGLLVPASARRDARAGEALALAVLRPLAPLLPRAWRPVPVAAVARAMLGAALAAAPGRHVIESAALAG